ncbi:hypothetical protein [Mycoplasma sp. CSL7503-lung]|uniref:hypothetical protein n=1 Tax=Mycoplasma sp. CSL7503-lung TaxID=536372 RepID=UPI0021CE0FE8|nr:hypothetical protein [Mycoplasma sp. CSL7503-lung]MCU4706893.1 hypothetical protein [Mycoplasma sp. CSL7503-lung]
MTTNNSFNIILNSAQMNFGSNRGLATLPLWAKIILIISLVLLSLIMIFFHKNSKEKIADFKEKQLEQYIKDNPRHKNIKYESTGLFLPAWQRAKYNFPLFMSVVFLSIAIIILILTLKG